MSDPLHTVPVHATFLVLLSAGIAVLEVSLFVGSVSAGALVYTHILVVCGCILIASLYHRCHWDLRYPALLCILVAVLGPFGALISAAVLFLQAVYGRSSQTLVDLLSSLFPESHFDSTAHLYERIIYGLDNFDASYNPMPFKDVITFGTEKQKRLAIEKILRYFRPAFTPALRKALNDPSNGIRVLAATAMTTLDQVFFETYLELEKQYNRRPQDFEAAFELAAHCDQYVESEILDEDRSQKMVDQAIAAYERCLAIQPANGAICTALGRLYITNRQPERAKELLEEGMRQTCEVGSHISKWYLCALYDLKHYDALREFIQVHLGERQEGTLFADEKDLIFTWCPEVVSASAGDPSEN